MKHRRLWSNTRRLDRPAATEPDRADVLGAGAGRAWGATPGRACGECLDTGTARVSWRLLQRARMLRTSRCHRTLPPLQQPACVKLTLAPYPVPCGAEETDLP